MTLWLTQRGQCQCWTWHTLDPECRCPWWRYWDWRWTSQMMSSPQTVNKWKNSQLTRVTLRFSFQDPSSCQFVLLCQTKLHFLNDFTESQGTLKHISSVINTHSCSHTNHTHSISWPYWTWWTADSLDFNQNLLTDRKRIQTKKELGSRPYRTYPSIHPSIHQFSVTFPTQDTEETWRKLFHKMGSPWTGCLPIKAYISLYSLNLTLHFTFSFLLAQVAQHSPK